MQIKSVFLFLVLAGFVFSSSLLADIVDPVGDVEINQNRIFNVTVNVSCSDGACGDVNVSLNNYQSSCKALLDAGLSTGDGVYTIYPPGHPEGVDVYCEAHPLTPQHGMGGLLKGTLLPLRTSQPRGRAWLMTPFRSAPSCLNQLMEQTG
jgi:hypothetical protein